MSYRNLSNSNLNFSLSVSLRYFGNESKYSANATESTYSYCIFLKYCAGFLYVRYWIKHFVPSLGFFLFLFCAPACLIGNYSQAPRITTEYSSDSWTGAKRARVNLHIQKPKPQASLKNKLEKFQKLFVVYNTIHKKLITLPWQCGFSWGGKKLEYAKPRAKLRGVSFGKIGLTTVAVTHDLFSGMPLVLLKKELIRLWNSKLPEPEQPSAQLSKLIRLAACKTTKHAVSRGYRTVYIRWLVASYYTHKGNRWLNSNPPSHRGM